MAKAELKKKFEDVAKLEEVVAELKVQNQQFTNKRDAAVDKLVKSEMLITELRDREARSKMLAIAEFKSSSDFKRPSRMLPLSISVRGLNSAKGN